MLLAHLDHPTSFAGLAKSGVTCSNLLTYRPAPTIMEWEIPTYLDAYNGTLTLRAQETMYASWIGTNDPGVNAPLTGSDAPDVSIISVRQCAVDVLNRLYESGARNSIMQNVRRKFTGSWPKCLLLARQIIPLDLTIMTPRTRTSTSTGPLSATQPSGMSTCGSPYLAGTATYKFP